MYLKSQNNTLTLSIKVVPNASRTALAGILGNHLKIKTAQPPEQGKANDAILALLASILQIPKSHLTITTGHTRPHKTLRITNLPEEEARARLTAALSFPRSNK